MKKKIKTILEALPHGIGVGYAIPIIRRIKLFFLFNQFKRRIWCSKEANNLLLNIKSNVKKIIIVHDNFVSPPTIGDFLYTPFLARYFSMKKLAVTIYVIDGEYRDDWAPLSIDEKNRLINVQLNLSRIITKKHSVEIKKICWLDFEDELKKITSDHFIYCRERVESRSSLYKDSFNILNFLLSKEKKEFINKFLLKSVTDFNPKNQFFGGLPEKYVAWHVRRDERWGLERNLSEKMFAKYYEKIRNKFPTTPVILVSDKLGCQFYKNIASSYKLNLLFSKDFGDCFYDDCNIILNAEFYYQLRGGGIGLVAIFSSVSYEIIDPCSNEIPWKYPAFTSWASKNQKRYFSLTGLMEGV